MSPIITDPVDIRLSPILNLKQSSEHLVVDSLKCVEKFLNNSDLKPLELFIDEKIANQNIGASKFTQIHIVKSECFNQLSGMKFHKGIIALFEKPQPYELKDLEFPFVATNGITSPENMGSIVRSLAGLGIKTLIYDGKSCDPYLRRAIRVGMGNVVFLKTIRVDSLHQLFDEGLTCYATANEKNSVSFFNWHPNVESGFFIGSEGHGLDHDLIKKCEATIRIPIKPEVQHLNAANSCSIIASRYAEMLLD